MGTPFDTELKYLLTHYCRVNFKNHEIQLMLDKNDVHPFDDLIVCDKQILVDLKRKKGNTTVSINSLNIKKINNVLLCYPFIRVNNDKIVVGKS